MDQGIEEHIELDQHHPTFVSNIGEDGSGWTLMDINGPDRAIVITYFAMTSLSTVGLGDYYPISDEERIIYSFVLLFGVMLFSIFMGQLIDMIYKYKKLDEEFN